MKFTMLHPTTDEAHPLFDTDILVDFDMSKGCKGQRDSLGGVRNAGPALSPDENPDIEINGATDKDGKAVILTDEDAEAIVDYFWDNEDKIMPDPNEGRDEKDWSYED